MKIADPYTADLNALFAQLHYATVSGNAGAWWSCTCGTGSTRNARTQGIAAAARDRHLRNAHRTFVAELENGATHVVEFFDHSWGGWRRVDVFGDRPQAEFPIGALARREAHEVALYTRRVRIRTVHPSGHETIKIIRDGAHL